MTAEKISTRFDETEIDGIFATVDQCRLPGAAVGIAIDGVPVYRRGFGLANMELPALLTPSMRMRIGSTTKHFACLAYLLLCEDGLAGLDDEIGTHVPGLHEATRHATMRRLMGHSSGIRDLLSVTLMTNGANRPVTDAEMIAYYATIDDVDFAAGTRWSYNNGGYILLSAAIENIAGEPLGAVLRKRIFEPAGMHDTMLRRWDSDFVPNSATLHTLEADGRWSRTYMGMEISGAGGMVSTMDDMLRWLKHMDAPVVGSAASWAAMREPHRLTSGVSTGYGFGLISGTYRGVEVLHHAGGVMGGNSQMIKVPAARLDISVAVNRPDISGSALANQIIDACVEGLAPAPERAGYQKRTGSFLSKASGRVMTLSIRDELHMMAVDGGGAVPVSPDAGGVLRLPAVADFLQQSVRAEGDAMIFSDFGDEDVLAAIETDADATLGGHAGTYRAEAFDATISIAEEADGVRATMRGRHGRAGYRLEPITADIWRIENSATPMLSAIVTFDADGGGFTMDATRMRKVRFVRAD